MQDTQAIWSQKDAIEYEATQELLTKVLAMCFHGLLRQEQYSEHIPLLRSLLNDVQSTKKNIQPTTPNLKEIRSKYRDVIALIHTYVRK